MNICLQYWPRWKSLTQDMALEEHEAAALEIQVSCPTIVVSNPILICLNRELQREGEEESGQLDLEDTLQLGASRPFAVVF